MPLNEVRQYEKANLGDTIIVDDPGFKDHNQPGVIIAISASSSQVIYCIQYETGKHSWHTRNHFRLAERANRELLSEAERYRRNHGNPK